jgi:GNAT superfamily N-acetyltransferase
VQGLAGVRDDLLDDFFSLMARDHNYVMADKPHICRTATAKLQTHYTSLAQVCFCRQRKRAANQTRRSRNKKKVLERLHTHPDHRGRGAATAAVRHGTAVLAGPSALPVYLDAAPLAVPLYRRLGYAEQDTEARWRADEGTGSSAPASGEDEALRGRRPFTTPMLLPASLPSADEVRRAKLSGGDAQRLVRT